MGRRKRAGPRRREPPLAASRWSARFGRRRARHARRAPPPQRSATERPGARAARRRASSTATPTRAASSARSTTPPSCAALAANRERAHAVERMGLARPPVGGRARRPRGARELPRPRARLRRRARPRRAATLRGPLAFVADRLAREVGPDAQAALRAAHRGARSLRRSRRSAATPDPATTDDARLRRAVLRSSRLVGEVAEAPPVRRRRAAASSATSRTATSLEPNLADAVVVARRARAATPRASTRFRRAIERARRRRSAAACCSRSATSATRELVERAARADAHARRSATQDVAILLIRMLGNPAARERDLGLRQERWAKLRRSACRRCSRRARSRRSRRSARRAARRDVAAFFRAQPAADGRARALKQALERFDLDAELRRAGGAGAAELARGRGALIGRASRRDRGTRLKASARGPAFRFHEPRSDLQLLRLERDEARRRRRGVEGHPAVDAQRARGGVVAEAPHGAPLAVGVAVLVAAALALHLARRERIRHRAEAHGEIGAREQRGVGQRELRRRAQVGAARRRVRELDLLLVQRDAVRQAGEDVDRAVAREEALRVPRRREHRVAVAERAEAHRARVQRGRVLDAHRAADPAHDRELRADRGRIDGRRRGRRPERGQRSARRARIREPRQRPDRDAVDRAPALPLAQRHDLVVAAAGNAVRTCPSDRDQPRRDRDRLRRTAVRQRTGPDRLRARLLPRRREHDQRVLRPGRRLRRRVRHDDRALPVGEILDEAAQAEPGHRNERRARVLLL